MKGLLPAIFLGVVGAWPLGAAAPVPPDSPSAAAERASVEHPKGWAILRFNVRVDERLDSDEVVAVRASSETR